jgi:glycosyltransferase involved in cell wall biosynthesis
VRDDLEMRILHVTATDQRRGAELFASQLIAELAQRGLSQRTVVLRRTLSLPIDYGDLVDRWESGGWKVPPLKVDFASVLRLRKLVREWIPDLIQAHGGEALKYALAATFGTRAKIVYRKIGEVSPWATRGARKHAHAKLMRKATGIVTVAEAMRREAIGMFGVPPDRVFTIPRGVDPRLLEPTKNPSSIRSELGISEKAKVIISLGALSWEKDPVAHVEIANRAMSSDERVEHLIVGDGPLMGRVMEEVAVRGIKNRTHSVGVRADVGDLLAASDVMLLASRTEGMPGCLIEAGMAGLPVAAYDVGGVSEIVQAGVTGLLARPGDIHELTRCVVSLLSDDEVRKAIGSAARRRCHQLFDVRVVAEEYISLYQRLVTSGSQAFSGAPAG